MLSNFGNRKADKDEAGAATPTAAPASSMPPPTPNTPQRQAVPARNDRTLASMIGPDLQIIGNLVSKGEVHIEGEIQGDILGTHVLIGERARITGGVSGEEVVVRGTVMGSVRGKKVALQATSRVEGDIYHKSLAIEQGAFFEGKSRRAEDPTAQPARSDTPVTTPVMATAAPGNAMPNGNANGSAS